MSTHVYFRFHDCTELKDSKLKSNIFQISIVEKGMEKGVNSKIATGPKPNFDNCTIEYKPTTEDAIIHIQLVNIYKNDRFVWAQMIIPITVFPANHKTTVRFSFPQNELSNPVKITMEVNFQLRVRGAAPFSQPYADIDAPKLQSNILKYNYSKKKAYAITGSSKTSENSFPAAGLKLLQDKISEEEEKHNSNPYKPSDFGMNFSNSQNQQMNQSNITYSSGNYGVQTNPLAPPVNPLTMTTAIPPPAMQPPQQYSNPLYSYQQPASTQTQAYNAQYQQIPTQIPQQIPPQIPTQIPQQIPQQQQIPPQIPQQQQIPPQIPQQQQIPPQIPQQQQIPPQNFYGTQMQQVPQNAPQTVPVALPMLQKPVPPTEIPTQEQINSYVQFNNLLQQTRQQYGEEMATKYYNDYVGYYTVCINYYKYIEDEQKYQEQLKIQEELLRKEEERKHQEEMRRIEEEKAKKAEELKRLQEAQKRLEEEQRKLEEEQRRKEEEERKRKEEEERRKREEEERRKREEEERRRREEEERIRREEEERRRKEEEELRKQQLLEQQRQAELLRQQQLLEQQRQAELLRQQQIAEQQRQAELLRQQQLAEQQRQAELLRQQQLAEQQRQAYYYAQQQQLYAQQQQLYAQQQAQQQPVVSGTTQYQQVPSQQPQPEPQPEPEPAQPAPAEEPPVIQIIDRTSEVTTRAKAISANDFAEMRKAAIKQSSRK